MFEEVFAPLPDAEAYLRRIGYTGGLSVTRETLDALISAHELAVPFENLTVYDGDRNVSLKISDIFDKIVLHRRGGYCFEQNSLFCALLLALGFDARAISGRTVWQKEGRGFMGHRATLVNLDGKRLLCDVGFGGPLSERSLDVDDTGLQRAQRDTFYFTPSEFGETMLNRQTEKGGEALVSLSFNLTDVRDFLPINYYFDNSPDSHFRKNRIVNLRTENGFRAIDNDMLILNENGVTERRRLTTPQEVTSALSQYFGIDFEITRV